MRTTAARAYHSIGSVPLAQCNATKHSACEDGQVAGALEALLDAALGAALRGSGSNASNPEPRNAACSNEAAELPDLTGMLPIYASQMSLMVRSDGAWGSEHLWVDVVGA